MVRDVKGGGLLVRYLVDGIFCHQGWDVIRATRWRAQTMIIGMNGNERLQHSSQ